MSHVDKRDVLAALTAERTLDHFGIAFRKSGKELRFQICPECGPRTRTDSVSVSAVTGRFRCLVGGCKGDLLGMVAGYSSIDLVRDFEAVLRVAADIAGIPEPGADMEAFRAAVRIRQAEARAREQVAAEWREKRKRESAAIWQRLARDSGPGEAYLESRGIGIGDYAAAGVRFGRHSVCLPLWKQGEIVNVVGRRFDGGEPKVRGLAGCTTKASFGNMADAPATTGAIVIVEGFMDYLSARVLYPTCLVLGASGADMLPVVAELATAGGWARDRGVHLVPHADEAGRRGVDKAAAVLARAGVDPEHVTYLEPEGDLNDHLMARLAERAT